ncbi:SMP-30/gluconolactonase/LRE family protein [Microbacteriaceae bacterium VKM Ac-2855]|nr:SMP-30/gluconolactonase/LRE family protein [Microbacteriaceae bacterium VKM Ac-2855]
MDIVVDVKPSLGEGPLWDVDTDRLYFVDSKGGRVYRCTEHGSEVRAWDVPGEIGSLAVRSDGGGAIVALENGFHTLDFATGDVTLIHDPEPDLPDNRLNDGKVDRHGRFVVGSMNRLEDGATAALYVLDTDFRVRTLDTGIIVSNGPCWSPDGATLYFADTWSGEIWAYDYDQRSGTVAGRRTFATVDTTGGGAADGATVDSEGFVWSALVYDGKLVRYAPDGTVDRIIDMPVSKVTSVMFGGRELDTLFVTSMAKPPLPRFPGDPVQAGSLFAIRGLGIAGLPENRFGA